MCVNKKRGEPNCNKCRDTTFDHDFLMKKIKPRSGNLNMGIINLEALPLLLTEFLDHVSGKPIKPF